MRGRPVGRGGGRPVGPQPSPHSSRGWRPHTVGVRAPLSGWRIAAPVLLCSARPAHTAPSQRPAALSPNTAVLRRSAPKGSAAPEVPSARQRQPGAAGPAVKPGRPAAVGPPNRHPPPRGRAGSGPARDEGQRGGGRATHRQPAEQWGRAAAMGRSADGGSGAAQPGGTRGSPAQHSAPPEPRAARGRADRSRAPSSRPIPAMEERPAAVTARCPSCGPQPQPRPGSTARPACSAPRPPCPRRVVVCTCTDPPSLPAARRAPPGSSAGCPPA